MRLFLIEDEFLATWQLFTLFFISDIVQGNIFCFQFNFSDFFFFIFEPKIILDLFEMSSWVLLKEAALTAHSHSIQQQPGLTTLLSSLSASVPPTPLPSPAPDFHPLLTSPPHLSPPLPSRSSPTLMLLTWDLLLDLRCTDRPPVWSCQISNSFDSPSLPLAVSVLCCDYRFLPIESRLHRRERFNRIKEEGNQHIVRGWHDGHYRCMMANYNLFFSICLGADRISK